MQLLKQNIEQINSVLNQIPDPEIPVVSIKELGMLRGVRMVNEQYVITITPTYTGCPAMGLIEQQIKENLKEIGVENVKVELTYSPAWTTDWMSEEAKTKMRKYGIAPPQHSGCMKIFNGVERVSCPQCNSADTKMISRFGSTACKSLYACNACKEPFEYFKCHS